MKNEIYGPHRASFLGADANLIAMLSYLASTIMGFIPILRYVAFFAPLIIYFIEKDSTFVKFHSMQAFLLNVISSAINFVYSMIMGVSIVGMAAGTKYMTAGIASAGVAIVVSSIVLIIAIIILVTNIMAMIGAYKYKEYHIPLIGNWAANIAHTN